MEKWVKCNSKFILLISSITIIPIEGYTINDVDDINVQATENLQQLVSIQGTVVDSEGIPLIGVNIVEVGNDTNGTITDIDGNFVLEINPGASIRLSYIGYMSQTVKITKTKDISITLREDTETLDEVIVVGYGSQKKVSVTGAISAVTTNDLKKTSTTRLDNALAGRITGLSSTQTGGGQPGVDGATMFLRGAATTNGQSPLILVDGVERSNISTIDMNEVESVSVLKDASATAVFGVRGANGVLMITTRKGEKGKPHLSASIDESWTSFSREPSRLHSWDYMALRNQALRNDGLPAEYTDAIIQKYRDPLFGLDPSSPDYAKQVKMRQYMYCDNDFYREYIKKYTPQTRINANVSGGTDFVTYFFNAGYIHQGGNLNTEPESQLGYDPSSWMNRWSFRSNLDFNLAKSLKAELKIGSYTEKVNMPAVDPGIYSSSNHMMTDLIYQALTITPISPGPTTISEFGVEDGALVDVDYLDRTSYEIMNRYGFYTQTRNNLNTQLALNWDLSSLITPGLSIKGMVSYDTYSSTVLNGTKREISYYATVDYDNDVLTYTPHNTNATQLSLSRSYSSNYRINAQASLNYDRKFGRHAVTGMVLFQRDYWESESAEIPYNIVGLSGRATYSYDNRYLAEVNIGYNGSEQFAPTKRFGFFPAGSIGWVTSNEEFLKGNNYLTHMKLRFSVGKVGNDQIGGSRFLYQDNITLNGASNVGGLGSFSVNEGLLGNPNITWELATKYNAGVDLEFFKSLNMSVDYYRENRSQILISRQSIPDFQGVPSGNIPKANMGVVHNQGVDLEVSYNKQVNSDFSFFMKGNFGFNKNKVIEFDEPQRTEGYVYRYRTEGFSLGQCWGYAIDWNSPGKGYFTSEEEIANYASYDFGTPRKGDFVYIDQNGDGVINDRDQVPIGYSSSIPGITYGFTVGAEYGGIDINVLFSGVGRYSMYYNGQGVFENVRNGTYYDWTWNAWTEERWQNGNEITYPALSTRNSTSHQANDFFIQNRSFLRLKNLEIGYTLPAHWLRSLGVSKFRVYVGGQNLFVWDALRSTHLDPEQSNPYGYPITKNINIGCNINF